MDTYQMGAELQAGIVRILTSKGTTAGTGFVVTNDGLIATCSHVIQKKEVQMRGDPLPEKVNIIFRATGDQAEAWIETDWWRPNIGDDIAILRIDGCLPVGVEPLLLGSSSGTEQHDFFTFGFSATNPEQGSSGFGKILAETRIRDAKVLQLRSPEVSQGFSGAPILDTFRHRVVGMVRSIALPDTFGRSVETAFITPTEILRDVCPSVKLSEVCPYRNLEAFTEDDAAFFFGRERDIKLLLEKLNNDTPFLAIFGPSGSGKSSVVRAGLIPRLQKGDVRGSDRWEILVTRPMNHSFEQQLENLGQRSTHVAMIIDQFEELFVSYNEKARAKVIGHLINILDNPQHLTLIIIIRDDFFSLFLQQEGLIRWLDPGLVPISPTMMPDEVDEVIRKPARAVGWQFEHGLIETIVKDVMDATSRDGKRAVSTTVLPLLEFALTQLWERRQDGLITRDAYNRIGGVTGGLKQWADDAYYAFDTSERYIVRRIFTDLIHPGDENQHILDSRRRRELRSLIRQDDDEAKFFTVVQQLTRDRLLVMSQDIGSNKEQVELIHDALLREWRLLKDWIEEDRHYLGWQEKLEGKIEEWEESNAQNPAKPDTHLLLGEKDLAEAAEWLTWMAAHKGSPRKSELDFIEASKNYQRREINRLRRRNAVLSILLIVAIISGSLAGIFYLRTNDALQIAQSRALAANANYYLLKNQIDLALLLSVKAYQSNNNYETRDSLLNALEYSPLISKIFQDDISTSDTSSEEMTRLVFSPNSRDLVSSRIDGRTVLWDTITGKHRLLLTPGELKPLEKNGSDSIALSQDSSRLATSCSKGLWVWNIKTGVGKQLTTLSGENILGFNQDNHILVTEDEGGGIVLWNVISMKRIGSLFTDDQAHRFGQVGRWAFSSDGKFLAISICSEGNMITENGGYPLYCGNGDIILWNVTSMRPIGSPLTGHQTGVRSLAFSPDSHILASGGTDHTIVLWNTLTQQPIGEPLVGHADWVESLAFSPDGQLLASGSSDGTIRLWNIGSSANDIASVQNFDQPLRGHGESVATIAFSSDGRQFASSSSDGTSIIIWNVPFSIWHEPLDSPISHEIPCLGAFIAFVPHTHLIAEFESSAFGNVNDSIDLCDITSGKLKEIYRFTGKADIDALDFSPDGRVLALYYTDGAVVLWDIMARKAILHLKNSYHEEKVAHVITYSPNSRILATCCDKNSITLWDVATGHATHQLIHDAPVYTIAFSPDSKVIASVGSNKNIILWNVETGIPLDKPLIGYTDKVDQVVFSPDGHTLASRSRDGRVILWDVRTQESIEQLPITLSQFEAYNDMDFSTDGTILAVISGKFGNEITLWNVINHESVAHQLLSYYPILDVGFGPADQLMTIVNIGHGGIVNVLWETNVDSWISHACSIVNRNLTIAEWNQFVTGEPYSKVCPDLSS